MVGKQRAKEEKWGSRGRCRSFVDRFGVCSFRPATSPSESRCRPPAQCNSPEPGLLPPELIVEILSHALASTPDPFDRQRLRASIKLVSLSWYTSTACLPFVGVALTGHDVIHPFAMSQRVAYSTLTQPTLKSLALDFGSIDDWKPGPQEFEIDSTCIFLVLSLVKMSIRTVSSRGPQSLELRLNCANEQFA